MTNREDGANAGTRSIGRAALIAVLAMLPYMLGIGALVWISVAFGCFDLSDKFKSRDRELADVHLTKPPETQYDVKFETKCDVDTFHMAGTELTLYATCPFNDDIMHLFLISQRAPDGTEVKASYYQSSGSITAHVRFGRTIHLVSEYDPWPSFDRRTSTIVVRF